VAHDIPETEKSRQNFSGKRKNVRWGTQLEPVQLFVHACVRKGTTCCCLLIFERIVAVVSGVADCVACTGDGVQELSVDRAEAFSVLLGYVSVPAEAIRGCRAEYPHHGT
jgi:hypothetical protein